MRGVREARAKMGSFIWRPTPEDYVKAVENAKRSIQVALLNVRSEVRCHTLTAITSRRRPARDHDTAVDTISDVDTLARRALGARANTFSLPARRLARLFITPGSPQTVPYL